MSNDFYERTAYRLSDEPVPACFINLGAQFDAQVPDEPGSPLHYCVVLAESICARMADVEMYAFLIEDARKRQSLAPSEMDHDSDIKTAVLTRSFLIGYIGACRSLLDSSATALVALYDLPLVGAECSFQHGDFWHQFVVAAPNAHRRYHSLRLFFNQVYQWCGELAQRLAPIGLIEHHYGRFSRRETLLQVLDETNIDVRALADEAIGRGWIDPLLLHTRWKPQFLILCEKLCQDVAAAL